MKLLHAIIAFVVIIAIAFFIANLAYGETEKGCIIWKDTHLMKIGTYKHIEINQCDWLVNKLLYNGSNWHIAGYSVGIGDGYDGYFTKSYDSSNSRYQDPPHEVYVLTR